MSPSSCLLACLRNKGWTCGWNTCQILLWQGFSSWWTLCPRKVCVYIVLRCVSIVLRCVCVYIVLRCVYIVLRCVYIILRCVYIILRCVYIVLRQLHLTEHQNPVTCLHLCWAENVWLCGTGWVVGACSGFLAHAFNLCGMCLVTFTLMPPSWLSGC